MLGMDITKITIRSCFKQARANTKLSGALKRDLGIGPIAGFLAWLYLPGQQAMEEITAIALAVAAACLIWPCLEFTWNFVAAPIRILNENIETISSQIAFLSPAPTYEEPVPPNYAIWGKRTELRIDQAAMLMAGLHPDGPHQTPAYYENRGLLIEAVSKGKIERADRGAQDLKVALARQRSDRNVWDDINMHTQITMISLLKFLQEEELALEFVEKVEPHVPG